MKEAATLNLLTPVANHQLLFIDLASVFQAR
jgi:hypothetical protein